MNIHLTPVSSNKKTGPIPVTTSPNLTCPDVCPFKKGGCYAESGPLAIHFKAVSSGARGMDWGAFLQAVRGFKPGQLWRHNQAGDLPGSGDALDAGKLAELVAANKGRRGFTYSHKPVLGPSNRTARSGIKAAVRAGFVVNLSGNSISHADQLVKTGLPVAAVVPQNSPDRFVTPGGNRVVVCPAQRVAGISCNTCRLCAKADRGFVIGFRPHGTGARKVEAITSAA